MKNTSPVLEKLKQFVENAGSQAEAARRLDITESYISLLLRGKRPITDAIANQLGFAKVVDFVHIPVIGTFTGKGDEIGDYFKKAGSHEKR